MLCRVLGLRANTLLFVVLLLGPAALLAWLGFAATVPLEAELMRGARAELLRVGSQVTTALPERIEEVFTARTAELWEMARQLASALPERGMAAFAEAERRTPGLVLTDARGGVLWPAPPRDLGLPYLVEWDTFRAFERAGTSATLDAARAFVAGSLRARALVYVADATRTVVTADLVQVSDDDLAAAGPRAIAALFASPQGRERLQRSPGLLFATPAIETERQRWCDGLELRAFAVGQRLRVAAATGLVPEVVAGLPSGAALRRCLDVPTELAALEFVAEPCVVRLVPGSAALAAAGEDPSRVELLVATSLGSVQVEVLHRSLPALLAAARQRQWLTGSGVAALFVVMGIGVVLVRRALAHEASARQLRDQFLANVSHDLKTPLTSLRLHAEMLADSMLDTMSRTRYAAVVHAEGARMSALVEDLLDVSALQQGRRRIELEPVDLAAAVRAQAEAWRPLLERDGVELRVTTTGDAVALADPIALGRILTNLLQNAARHGRPSRDGGASWVELAAGPGPQLAVRDNGPGVPAELRERVFHRFERAGAAVDGLGLGLALARELAMACGGTLRCHDDGSTLFELVLPALPPDEPT
jgi:signal transduction histidine kinase